LREFPYLSSFEQTWKIVDLYSFSRRHAERGGAARILDELSRELPAFVFRIITSSAPDVRIGVRITLLARRGDVLSLGFSDFAVTVNVQNCRPSLS